MRLSKATHPTESLAPPSSPRFARLDTLEQLVTVAKQRFGTKQVMLLGTRSAQERLAQLAEERGLEIAEERQR